MRLMIDVLYDFIYKKHTNPGNDGSIVHTINSRIPSQKLGTGSWGEPAPSSRTRLRKNRGLQLQLSGFYCTPF